MTRIIYWFIGVIVALTLTNNFATLPTKISLTTGAVTDLLPGATLNSSAVRILDEQSLAGNPLNNAGGKPVNLWRTSQDTRTYYKGESTYPALRITLGASSDTITNASVYSYGGSGWILYYKSTDGTTFTKIDSSFISGFGWNTKTFAVNQVFRYLKIAKKSPAVNFSEIVVYRGGGVADTQAPTAPTNVIASNITSTTTNLSWNVSTDNIGVTGYDVFKDGVYLLSSVSNSTSVAGLTPATTYAFTIKAKDAAGNVSTASTSINVTTLSPPDTQAPTVPTSLASNSITQTGFTLTWTASTDNVGVVGYDVYRNGTKLNNNTVTALNYSVTGLTPNTNSSMTVVARDAANNTSAASSPLSVTTTANAAPTANAGADQSITLPTNSIVLSGSGSDSDGTIAGYAWTQQSGPNTATLSGQTTTSLSVTNLIQGSYVFRLTVTDNWSATGTDDVTITVNASTAPTLENTWIVNFASNNQSAVTNYNSLRPTSFPVASGTTYSNLINSSGGASTIGLQTTTTIPGGGNNSGTCSTGSLYSATAMNAWWRIQDAGSMSFKFTGLNVAKAYTLIFSTTSGTNNSIPTYTVTGNSSPISKTLNAQNNCSNSVTFSDIVPNSSGEIVITVNRSTGYYEAGISVIELRQYSGVAPPDNTAPAAITTLAVTTTTSGSATLQWTAVGNDNLTGTATSYIGKYNTTGINSSNFDSQQSIIGLPTPTAAGTTQSYTVTGLTPSTTYYFALKASDGINTSAFGNVAQGTTQVGTGEQFITIDPNNAFNIYWTTTTTDNLWNKTADYLNGINPSTFYYPNALSGSIVTNNEIIVDLGTTWDLTQVILGGVLQGESSNIVSMVAGSDWAFPSTRSDQMINWESTNFVSYTGGNLPGYTTFTVTKTTRYIKIYVNGRGNAVGSILFKGIRQGSIYTPPSLPSLTASDYTPVSDIIGTLGNERDTYQTNGSLMLGSDGGSYRNFTPWYWLENSADGTLGFNPPASGSQDDYDYIMRETSKRGGRPFFCFWQSPDWMGKAQSEYKPTWPNGSNPVFYASYDKHSNITKQILARYGTGTAQASDIAVNSSNAPLRNLGYSDLYESWNEPTKWWKDREGFFSLYEYFAMLDGEITGAKSVNANAKIIVGAPDIFTKEVVRSIIWMLKKKYPGVAVNTLIYGFALHYYSNPTFTAFCGNPNTARSPEFTQTAALATSITDILRAYAPGTYFAVTEYGYDLLQASNMSPKLYGSFTSSDLDYIRAIWTGRQILEYATVAKVDIVNYHQLQVDQGQDANCTNFQSGGLWIAQGGLAGNPFNYATHRYKPWWVLANIKSILKDYRFKDIINSNNALVKIVRFEHKTTTGLYTYAVWCPTEAQNVVSNYSLALPAGYTTAKKINLSFTDLAGSGSSIAVSSNTVTFNVTEEPVFIEAFTGTLPTEAQGLVYKRMTLNSSMVVNESGATDAALMVNEQSNLQGEPLFYDITGVPSSAQSSSWSAGTSCYFDLGASVSPVAFLLTAGDFGDGNVDMYYGTPGNWTQVQGQFRITGTYWYAIYFPKGVTTRYIRLVKPSGVKVAEGGLYVLSNSSL